MKKQFLAEREIRKYEQLSDSEVSSVFLAMGVQKGAQLFCTMLESYRMAARVANAAWRLVDAEKSGDAGQVEHCREELTKALHGYAPGNFSPHRSDLVFAAECFEKFYNDATQKSSKEEVEELIFEWTTRLYASAEALSVPKPGYKQIVVEGRQQVLPLNPETTE